MDRAREAISKHLGGAGKHTTTHHETVAPAVQHETVNPSRHEEVTTAVDREVHQDHYHTSVQPIQDTQTLPETHKHNVAPVQHTQHEHDNPDFNSKTLQTEAAKYKNEQVIADTVHTQAVAPTVGGEHVHHHVHETVQPVVHKTTLQPEVVHTTVPVHEVHHNAAQHHGSVQLPAMTMNEYAGAGRVLQGSEGERTEQFKGEPSSIAALAPVFGHGEVGRKEHVRDPDHAGAVNHAIDPEHNRHSGLGRGENLNSGLSQSGNKGTTLTTGTTGTADGLHSTGPGAGLGGTHTGPDTHLDRSGNSAFAHKHEAGTTDPHDPTATHKKPSLLDRLNPKVDSDGDGKAGFMK